MYVCLYCPEEVNRALTSGEWIVDNNQLSEQRAAASEIRSTNSIVGQPEARGTTNSGGSGTRSSGMQPAESEVPKLMPVKSFRNSVLNLSVRKMLFC